MRVCFLFDRTALLLTLSRKGEFLNLGAGVFPLRLYLLWFARCDQNGLKFSPAVKAGGLVDAPIDRRPPDRQSLRLRHKHRRPVDHLWPLVSPA